jgi:CRP-like cAMP-binding protein
MDTTYILNKVKSYFSSLFHLHEAPLPYDQIMWKSLRSITKGLEEKDLQFFLKLGKEVQFQQGEYVFKELDPADSIYIILKGKAEVIKHSLSEFGEEHSHVIAVLKKEDVLGDMALIESKPRSADVRAKTPLTALIFNIQDIKDNASIHLVLTKNLAKMLSRRLRYTNEVTVKNMAYNLAQARARNALGAFMVVIFWFISLYTLSLTTLIKFKAHMFSSTPISISLIFIFTVAILIAMRKTGIPMARFGITIEDWKAKCLQAILYTLPLMFFFLAVKLDAVYFGENHSSKFLFSGPREYIFDGKFEPLTYFFTLTAYIIFTPVQELVTRCALQTTFFLFLPGTELARKWNSIVLSNLIFAAVHSHMDLLFAVGAFFPGLFWGWLFHKQQSLIGVSVSHVLLGVWVLFILGV